MLMVSYDFTDDKTRSRFSKFLKRYGHRVQYSIYEVRNSQTVLKKILNEVELVYKPQFKNTDSILIFQVCGSCIKKIKRYGYAKYELESIVVF